MKKIMIAIPLFAMLGLIAMIWDKQNLHEIKYHRQTPVKLQHKIVIDSSDIYINWVRNDSKSILYAKDTVCMLIEHGDTTYFEYIGNGTFFIPNKDVVSTNAPDAKFEHTK